jgi:hypothetical protein
VVEEFEEVEVGGCEELLFFFFDACVHWLTFNSVNDFFCTFRRYYSADSVLRE